MVDWLAIKQELRNQRISASLEEADIAAAGVSALSTVYRIEKLDVEKPHRPDLETIDRWITATGGTLSNFFARVEARAGSDLHGKLKEDGSEPVGEALTTALQQEGGQSDAESESSSRVRELARTVEQQGKQLAEQREQLAQQRADIEAFKLFTKHLGTKRQQRTTRKASDVEPKDGKGHRPRR